MAGRGPSRRRRSKLRSLKSRGRRRSPSSRSPRRASSAAQRYRRADARVVLGKRNRRPDDDADALRRQVDRDVALLFKGPAVHFSHPPQVVEVNDGTVIQNVRVKRWHVPERAQLSVPELVQLIVANLTIRAEYRGRGLGRYALREIVAQHAPWMRAAAPSATARRRVVVESVLNDTMKRICAHLNLQEQPSGNFEANLEGVNLAPDAAAP